MFVAGSPSNMLTLWRVRDDSTADFMVSFYKNLLWNDAPSNKVSKADALRRAQLTLRSDPRYSHPFFWAPFVLIGDGR
jgi:CHAT domain-containing protein